MLITEAATNHPGCIRTISGIFLNPLDLNPELLTVEDIAYGLAHQFRFGGHTKHPVTVAEHSIRVATLLPAEYQMAGLFHDALEGLGLPDLITPVKRQIPGYEEAENKSMAIVAEKFGFEWPLHPAVKEADKQALVYEWDNYKIGGAKPHLTHETAPEVFIIFYETLKNSL